MATDRMSDGWEETRFGGFFVACHPWRQPFGPSQATSKIVPDDFLLSAEKCSLLLANEGQQCEQRQSGSQQCRA